MPASLSTLFVFLPERLCFRQFCYSLFKRRPPRRQPRCLPRFYCCIHSLCTLPAAYPRSCFFFCFCFFIVVVIVIVQSYSPHTYPVQCHYGHWSWQTPTSLSVISCLCRQLPLHHPHDILLLQSLVLPLRPLAQRSCRSRLPPPLPAIRQFIGSTSQPQTLDQATSSTSTSFFCFLVSLSLEL